MHHSGSEIQGSRTQVDILDLPTNDFLRGRSAHHKGGQGCKVLLGRGAANTGLSLGELECEGLNLGACVLMVHV